MANDPPWAKSSSDGHADAADVEASAREAPLENQETPKKKKRKKKKNYIATVAQSLAEGERETVVIEWLRNKGLAEGEIERTLEAARVIAGQQAAQHADNHGARPETMHAQRQKDVLYGGLWLGGGLLLTLVTYASASEGGGGRYVLAWGPIIYGAIRLFRAL